MSGRIAAGILLVVVMGVALSCDSGGDDSVGDTDVVEKFISDANSGSYGTLTNYMLPTAAWYADLSAQWWEQKIAQNCPLELTAYNIPLVYIKGADGSEFYFTLESYDGNLTISKILRDQDDVIGEVLFR